MSRQSKINKLGLDKFVDKRLNEGYSYYEIRDLIKEEYPYLKDYPSHMSIFRYSQKDYSRVKERNRKTLLRSFEAFRKKTIRLGFPLSSSCIRDVLKELKR
jgi:hypothetical protein